MSAPLVQVRGVSGGYGGPTAIEGLAFEVEPGQVVAVLGPNGGGKTTLFRALLGELPTCEGELTIAGRPAYIPQTERSQLDFPVSALDVVLMGAYGRTPWWRRLARRDRAEAAQALAEVGLAGEAQRRFGELSGGQRQRVVLARALLQRARVLILDEPFSGVDRTSAARIEGVLDTLRRSGCGVLIATHDINHARRCDRVLCLHRRQIAFGPPTEALTPQVLRATYGAELVELGDGSLAVATDHHEHRH